MSIGDKYWIPMVMLVLPTMGFVYAVTELRRATIEGERFLKRAVNIGGTVAVVLLFIAGGTHFIEYELFRTVDFFIFLESLIIIGYIILIFILKRYRLWERYRGFFISVALMPNVPEPYRFVIKVLVFLTIILAICCIASYIYLVRPALEILTHQSPF